MTAYYNENDPAIADWLEDLIAAELIAPGDVDRRSIEEVTADDVQDYLQCHFFAGVGGWSYALRLAGWADSEQVWTGSCPCQPFSAAGKRKGTADERHLWPEFRRLIADSRPPVVFGEQVASKDGRRWLTGVRGEMEALGYGVPAADLCAAGIGAPHLRQRLFFVAHAEGERSRPSGSVKGEPCGRQQPARRTDARVASRVGDASADRLQSAAGRTSSMAIGTATARASGPSGLGHANGDGRSPRKATSETSRHGLPAVATGRDDPWADAGILLCGDGKARRAPVEPAFFPLADGLPGRVVQLCGMGNAIVPGLAAEFIGASREAIAEVAGG